MANKYKNRNKFDRSDPSFFFHFRITPTNSVLSSHFPGIEIVFGEETLTLGISPWPKAGASFSFIAGELARSMAETARGTKWLKAFDRLVVC